MTKQKTVIDQLLAMLEFRADAQALDRVDQKIEELSRGFEAATRKMQVVKDGDSESKVRGGANL